MQCSFTQPLCSKLAALNWAFIIPADSRASLSVAAVFSFLFLDFSLQNSVFFTFQCILSAEQAPQASRTQPAAQLQFYLLVDELRLKLITKSHAVGAVRNKFKKWRNWWFDDGQDKTIRSTTTSPLVLNSCAIFRLITFTLSCCLIFIKVEWWCILWVRTCQVKQEKTRKIHLLIV